MIRAARGRKAAARTLVALRLRAVVSLLACAAAAATFAAPAGAAGSMYELQVDGVQTADWSIYSGGGPELTGNTSSTVYNNVSRAYATGSDGSLWEYVASNSRGVGPRAANLSAITGAPAMQPGTAVTVFNSMLRVYSVSTGGVLYETVNNGANGREWNSYPINGAGAPALTGNLQATTVGGKLRVISVAASTGLPWELVVDNLNGREWNSYQAGTVALQGDIALTVYNGMPRVYGTDGYGTVWEMDRNGASGNIWNTYSLAGLAGTPSAKPGVAVTQYASMIRVFTIGRDGHLWETFNNGANGHEWNSYDNSGQAGLPAVRGHIRAVVAGGYMRTYVLGETGILYEALTNGGPWRSFALSSYVQGPEPETNVSVINDPAGQPRIYGLSTTTPTSWRYGGDDESVNTPDEADKVIGVLRSESDADATNTTNALSPADRTYVQQRAQATMPSSAAYGGANVKVDTDVEAGHYYDTYFGAGPMTQQAMTNGLPSDDQVFVSGALPRLYSLQMTTTGTVDLGVDTAEDGSDLAIDPTTGTAAATALKCRSAYDGKVGERRLQGVDKHGNVVDFALLQLKIGFCRRGSAARPNTQKPFWFAKADTINGFGQAGYRLSYGNSMQDAANRRTVKTLYGDPGVSDAYVGQQIDAFRCSKKTSTGEFGVSLDLDHISVTGGVSASESVGGCDLVGTWEHYVIGKPDGSAKGFTTRLK